MHRFRRSISTVGLGAITAMTVIGAIVVLPAAAGAATLRPVVNGAGVSSLLGGGTASVSQDYYDTALTGKYPIARFLYIYVNLDPHKPADPLIQQFMAFVLSKQGQEIVVKDGYFPLIPKMQAEQAAKLKIAYKK